MKLIIRIIIIGVITYFISPYFTWWTGMAISFFVCYIMPASMLNSFVAGFLGVGLVWLGQAWQLDVVNESSFSSKIVTIFTLDDPIYLVLLSGLIGGLSGALSSMTGTSFRWLFKKEKKSGYYS